MATYTDDPRVRKLLEMRGFRVDPGLPMFVPPPGELIPIYQVRGSARTIVSFHKPRGNPMRTAITAPLGSCLDASKRYLILPASHVGKWWFTAETAYRAAAVHSCGLRLN